MISNGNTAWEKILFSERLERFVLQKLIEEDGLEIGLNLVRWNSNKKYSFLLITKEQSLISYKVIFSFSKYQVDKIFLSCHEIKSSDADYIIFPYSKLKYNSNDPRNYSYIIITTYSLLKILEKKEYDKNLYYTINPGYILDIEVLKKKSLFIL